MTGLGIATADTVGVAFDAQWIADLFKQRAGVDMTHVPYKGAAPAMQAGLASQKFGAALAAPQVQAWLSKALSHE